MIRTTTASTVWQRLWNGAKKIDRFLDRHMVALALIAIVVALRIPSFAEPYWYGDEGIYLTIGNSLRAGERLYVDIIDHKTPIIYYLAALGHTQAGFRFVMLVAVAISTVAMYQLVGDLFSSKYAQAVALLVFITATNMPRYEAIIPNGELFVLCFVLLALMALRKTSIYQAFFQTTARAISRRSPVRSSSLVQKQDQFFLVLTGVLMGLATLTKVPAVFDLGAVLFICWIVAIDDLSHLRQRIQPLILISAGWLSVIVLSIFYYALRGSLPQYIDYGLLYNFRYAGSWIPKFHSAFTMWCFSLQGKVLLLGTLIIGVTLLRKKLTRPALFGLVWLGAALVATTLSNRPYPHYFLQLVPGIAIVSAALVAQLASTLPLRKKSFELLSCGLMILLVAQVMHLLQVTPYPTKKYYEHFQKMITRQISWEEYRDAFHPILKDNYAVARILSTSPESEIFIWGTDPLLYALSGKNPVGRFTVAFHIDDFHAYQETLNAIETTQPRFVVVLHDLAPLPGLLQYLETRYIPNNDFSTMTVWRRL